MRTLTPSLKEQDMKIDPKILELMASRICHDLISPVGAIRNGVEFAEEMGLQDSAEEAFELISLSARTAAARLQVFRLSYGMGGRDPSIRREDVHRLFGEMIEIDGKVAQDWSPHESLGFEDAPAGYCKTLLSTLVLAQDCLPKGGRITVEADGENRTRVTAQGEAPGQTAHLRPLMEEALAMELEIEDIDPRLVHPYVAAILAKDCGYAIKEKIVSPERIDFYITLS